MTDKKPTRPIAIYVRVSDVRGRDVEAEGGTAAEQERRCRAQLEALGLKAGPVFVDKNESGGKESRPQYDLMKEGIESGQYGGVIVWKLSRFGRRVRNVLRDIRWVEDQNAAFLCVNPAIDTSGPYGRFMLTVFSALDELELDQIGESWKRTHESTIARGITQARAPVGYLKDPTTKRLVRDEEHADTIIEAFRLKGETKATWSDIARYLTANGVPTKSGKPWSRTAARKLVSTRTYLGEARYVTPGATKEEDPGYLVNTTAHDPLVSERIFLLANKKGRRVGGSGHGGHLLSTIVRCGVCGKSLTKASTTSKTGKRYEFLRCQESGPGHVTIALKVIEPFLAQETLRRVELVEGETVPVEVPDEIAEKLTTVLAEIEALDEMVESEEITRPAYAKSVSLAERERDELLDLVGSYERGERTREVSPANVKRNAAVVALLTAMATVTDEETAAKIRAKTEAFAAARDLIKETLGTVLVAPGRGLVEERVTIEAAVGADAKPLLRAIGEELVITAA